MSKSIKRGKFILPKHLKISSAVLAAVATFLANHAKAAVLYFDPNGASAITAGTYTWDTTSLEWSTSSSLTGTPIAWVNGDAACFCAGTFTGAITVDVNSAINAGGFFDGNLTPPGCTVTLAGTGSLVMPTGAQALAVGGSDGNSLTVNIPLTGAGAAGESEEDGVNALNLYSANTFTGGFILGATSNGGPPNNDGVNINNSQSFGVGGTISSSSSSATREINTPLAAQSGPITLGQGLTLWGGILEFQGVQSAPVTITGAVALPASGTTATLQVQSTTDSGAGSTTLSLSGAISGAGNLSKTGVGTLVVSGANTYTGTTSVGAGVLQAGAVNAIGTTTGLTLAGGAFNPGGFNQSMTSAPLTLTGSSTIDYSAGTAEIDFANSSAKTWSGVLNLNGWVQGSTELNFGDSSTGLTSGQLADLEEDGTGLGTASLTPNGYVTFSAVPEPPTVILGLLGGVFMFRRARKQTA